VTAAAPQAQSLRNELLGRDAARAWVPPRQEQLHRSVARRRMQKAKRHSERRPRRAGQRLRGEQRSEVVLESMVLERRERAGDDAAQRRLVQAFGRRIDGCQAIARLGVVVADGAMLGMDHLEARRPAANFAVAPHALAARERLLDGLIEVEEPQRDRTGTVGEACKQRAAAAIRNLAELDDSLDEHFLADRETANRPDRSAVFVALRQQAEQIAERSHAELGETLGNLRAYTR